MMKPLYLIAAATVALLPVAASAQSAEADANNAVQATANARTEATQAGYDADMASYRAALRANHRQIAADDSAYLQRERAYADAMGAWRRQVWACDHGNTAACNAPTPNPADYM